MTLIDDSLALELSGQFGLGVTPARWSGALKVAAMAGGHVATVDSRATSTAIEQRYRRNTAVDQNVLIFVIEAPTASVDRLRDLITQIRKSKSADGPLGQIKTLHFLSMTLFEDPRFDATFVLEANIDGPPGPFWADLEAAIGPQLREVLRFCQRPTGLVGDKFAVVTAPGSEAPISPLLEALAVQPAAVHQGDRGASRIQIEQETALFADVGETMRGPSPFRGKSANEIHQALRAKFVPLYPTLKFPPRSVVGGWMADASKLLLSLALIVLALNVPGVLLARIISPFWATIVSVLAIAAFAWMLKDDVISLMTKLKAGGGQSIQVGAVPGPLIFLAVSELILAVVLVSLRIAFDAVARTSAAMHAGASIFGALFDQFKLIRGALEAIGHGQSVFQYLPAAYVWEGFQFAGVGLLGAVATALYIVLRLRALERQDPSQHQPDVSSQGTREIAALEDWGAQNHMSGLVHIKPGLIRSMLMRAGLNGLGLAIRADPPAAFDGYLITVRTIHFAHLTLVSNGSRLLFLANFDGTWNNYLVDFIEKVHAWLTLVWTNGVGFPPTRFFVFEGATHGRLFTNWQRQSMAPTLYWFQAYPSLSVQQIRRQARIADGLRKHSLKKMEAKAWAMDL